MRDDITAEYARAAAAISNAISGLSEGQSSRQEIDGWSVKDHITHLTLWHEMRFFEISRYARGAQAAFPGGNEEAVETINQTFTRLRRHLSFEQALCDLDFARAMVLQAIVAVPEARLDPELYEEMSPVGGAQHELAHAEMIKNWRQGEGR